MHCQAMSCSLSVNSITACNCVTTVVKSLFMPVNVEFIVMQHHTTLLSIRTNIMAISYVSNHLQ
jgi:hypothetical protein